MRRLFFLLIFVLTCTSAFAQQLQLNGRILDERTNAPVPFAYIGIRRTALGTVADALGHFRFTITEKTSTDSLLISCVGYQTHAVPAVAFLGHSPDIWLAQTKVRLAAVTVRPRKVKTFGRTGSSTLMGANIFPTPQAIEPDFLALLRKQL